MVRLPPKSVLIANARGSLWIWLLLRAVVLVLLGAPLMPPGATFYLVVAVAAILMVDLTVSRERLFLANLGVSRWWVAGIASLVAGTAELGSGLLLRWLLPALSGGG